MNNVQQDKNLNAKPQYQTKPGEINKDASRPVPGAQQGKSEKDPSFSPAANKDESCATNACGTKVKQ